jgi:CRAL/TRIO domain
MCKQEDEQTLLKRLSKLVSERHLDLGDATQETFQACLARYLRAANGDVAAALAAIEATVKWRTDIKLSLLRTQSAAQICGCSEAELARHFAVQTVVPIDGSAPGLLIVWRLTDLRLDDLLLAVSPDRLLRYYVWLRDRHCKALHDPARAASTNTAAAGVQAPKSSPTKQQPAAATEGSAAPRFRVVVDVGGVQLANLSLPALKLIRQLIAVDTRHYPGLLHSLDFVNAPPAFPFVWAALKPLLAQSTAAKIKVFAPADRGWRSPLLRYAALLPAVYVRPALPATAAAAAGSSALFNARAVAQRGSLLGATLRWLRDALWRPATAAEVVIIAYGASPAATVAALQSTPAAAGASSSGGRAVANAVPLLHPEQLLQLVSVMNAAAATTASTTAGAAAGSANSRGTPSPLRTPQRGLIRRATVGSGSSAEQQLGGRRSPVQHVRHFSSGASPSTLHSRHPAALSIAEGNEGSSGSSATQQQRSQQQQHRVEQLYGAEVAVMDTSEGPTAGAAADKVQIIATFSISVQAEGERWMVSRRLLEFVALRRRYV